MAWPNELVFSETKDVDAMCEFILDDLEFNTFICEDSELFGNTSNNDLDPVNLNAPHVLPSGDCSWNKQTETTLLDSYGRQLAELMSTLFDESEDGISASNIFKDSSSQLMDPLRTTCTSYSTDHSLFLENDLSTKQTELDLVLYDQIKLSETGEQLLDQDHSLDYDKEGRFAIDDIFPCLVRVKELEKKYTDSCDLGDSLTKEDEVEGNIFNSHAPVTPVIMEIDQKHITLLSVSPDANITNCNSWECLEEISTSCSNGSVVGNTQTVGNEDTDWESEKEIIVLKMLGKQDATNIPVALEAQLHHIVEEFQNYWKNKIQVSVIVPSEERSLRCFQRAITLILNAYCEQGKRRVRYLPDFCKESLSEWVTIEAHHQNPYPEKVEIKRLAKELGVTSNQVEQWFENYRVRKWRPEKTGIRKGKFFRYPPETTAVLKTWIINHKNDPNPRGKDMKSLTETTGMTSAQVKQWCYNFRRRHQNAIL